MQIFRKHICSATCGEMYYTKFYFKSDAISIEDGANFHLCCYMKYDIHCTQFHETALCGDLLNRIPLQIGQEKWKLLVYMYSWHQVWLSLLQFSESSRLLDNICKNTYIKFNRSWTDVWSYQTKVFFYFIKNAQHWRKKIQSTISTMTATGSLMPHFVPSPHELNAKSPIWLQHLIWLWKNLMLLLVHSSTVFIIYYFSLVLVSITSHNHLHGLG